MRIFDRLLPVGSALWMLKPVRARRADDLPVRRPDRT